MSPISYDPLRRLRDHWGREDVKGVKARDGSKDTASPRNSGVAAHLDSQHW